MAQRQLDLVTSLLEKTHVLNSTRRIHSELSRVSADSPVSDQQGRGAITYRVAISVDSQIEYCFVSVYVAAMICLVAFRNKVDA